MVAGAAFGALHPTVAGKEITAHAQGKAVGLITAKKLLFPDLHDWHQPLFAPIVVAQLGFVISVRLARHAGPSVVTV